MTQRQVATHQVGEKWLVEGKSCHLWLDFLLTPTWSALLRPLEFSEMWQGRNYIWVNVAVFLPETFWQFWDCWYVLKIFIAFCVHLGCR